MAKCRAILFFFVLTTLVLGATALAETGRFGTDAGALNGTAVTTSQTAVFSAFLSNLGPSEALPSGIDTAFSISNILAVPAGLSSDFLNLGGADDTGTVDLYMWNADGTAFSYSSDDDCRVGSGLNMDGTLGPGQTWTFLLADILDCLGLGRTAAFTGYGWAVGNFDAIAGTYNVTVFDVGFTQNFEMTPAVGQGQTFTGGIPVTIEP